MHLFLIDHELGSRGTALNLQLKVVEFTIANGTVFSLGPATGQFAVLVSILVVDHKFKDEHSVLEVEVVLLSRSEKHWVQ